MTFLYSCWFAGSFFSICTSLVLPHPPCVGLLDFSPVLLLPPRLLFQPLPLLHKNYFNSNEASPPLRSSRPLNWHASPSFFLQEIVRPTQPTSGFTCVSRPSFARNSKASSPPRASRPPGWRVSPASSARNSKASRPLGWRVSPASPPQEIVRLSKKKICTSREICSPHFALNSKDLDKNTRASQEGGLSFLFEVGITRSFGNFYFQFFTVGATLFLARGKSVNMGFSTVLHSR